MNKISRFFHELLNPHCEHCVRERESVRELAAEEYDRDHVCPTCEVLKHQLELANNTNRELIRQITFKPVEEVRPVPDENPKPVLPKYLPFSVRRQMLEAEKRREAKLMADAPKPDNEKKPSMEPVNPNKPTEDLEKELGIDNDEVENAG